MGDAHLRRMANLKKTSEWHLNILWYTALLITGVAMLPDVRADFVTQISVTVETEIATEIADSGLNSVSQKSGNNGYFIRIKFSILNTSFSDVSEQVADTIVSEVSGVMRGRLAYFKDASLFIFNFDSLHTITYLDLTFNQMLDEEQLDEVRKILYESIEVKNTIGNFAVDNLLISGQADGRMYPYNYCNVSGSCPSGAHCTGGVNTCTATCNNNNEFCLNRGTCEQSGDLIKCDCPKRFNGTRCEFARGGPFGDSLWIALIAVAGILALLLLLILLFCLCKRCKSQKSSNRDLYGVENVIGLHAVNDEMVSVGGVAIQTDDSFLLNLTYGNGVPPKSGYSHKIMQTNDSFLLARSQNPRASHMKGQSQSNGNTPNESSRPGTSDGTVRGDNKETTTLSNGSNSQSRTVASPDPNTEVKTSGSPRKIMTV